MSVTLTYPGVYLEEIPSGVRTITGVATSITAFIGRALRGPVNEPITINSYGDFERVFGGLWVESTLGYAVRDFYLNGGSQAIIVRLQQGATKASLTLPSGFVLEAAHPGAWGNSLRARVDHDVSKDVAIRYGLTQNELFNLTIRDMDTGVTEQFRNVSVRLDKPSPREVDKVLENTSALVRVSSPPTIRPEASDADLEDRATSDDPKASDLAKAELKKPPFTSDERSVGVAEDGKATDGTNLSADDLIGSALQEGKTGLYALERADLFNLLCIPPYLPSGDVNNELPSGDVNNELPSGDVNNELPSGDVNNEVIAAAAVYCEKRRAMLLVDPPSGWTDKETAKSGIGNGGVGTTSKNSAVYFPRLRQPNPLQDNQVEDFAPCGAVAGVFARTDAQHGVWKAPAGLEATLVNVPRLSVSLTDAENGELNPLGINCLRSMPPAGRLIWGARTLQGDDRLASEWKYIPVRRLALNIEESLYRGTQWVVFEPNDESLWAQIRLNVGSFMHNLFRRGAFAGRTPREAYFVKCDRETTTQDDVNRGIVNVVVGFAPLKPAEFVIVKIQQIAGQIEA